MAIKKNGINSSLILKNRKTDIEKLSTEKSSLTDISPSLEKSMFSMFLYGNSFKKISEYFTSGGYPISAHRVSKIANFYSWENKKLELDDNISTQMGNEIEMVRTRYLKSQNLMISAISDEINREYQEYIVDMSDYERGVLKVKPEKPNWLNAKNLPSIQDSWFKAQNKGTEKIDIDARSTMVNLGVSQDQVSEMLRVMSRGKRKDLEDNDILKIESPCNENGDKIEKQEEKLDFEIGKKDI